MKYPHEFTMQKTPAFQGQNPGDTQNGPCEHCGKRLVPGETNSFCEAHQRRHDLFVAAALTGLIACPDAFGENAPRIVVLAHGFADSMLEELKNPTIKRTR